MLKGVPEIFLKIILNQHKNNTCYVQSLKKYFYFGAPNSFDRVFTLMVVEKNNYKFYLFLLIVFILLQILICEHQNSLWNQS
jgi:hypothetical protein